jgi:hypothetical protein
MTATGDDAWSTFSVVSTETINIEGLAPHARLQNILGDNWPNPPLAIDHVTYCYLAEADSASIQAYANDELGATFRQQSVRMDGNRSASAHATT